MPKLFISGILPFLILGAGYGIISTAQPPLRNCADWQVFAPNDLPTAIPSSRAANRGKTLYCVPGKPFAVPFRRSFPCPPEGERQPLPAAVSGGPLPLMGRRNPGRHWRPGRR